MNGPGSTSEAVFYVLKYGINSVHFFCYFQIIDVKKGAHLTVVADYADAFILYFCHMWLGFPGILGFNSSRTNVQWRPETTAKV